MAGNREAYEQAMNAGHNAAWEQKWSEAVSAYGRALQQFPTDPDAHIHLGLSLFKAGRLDDALKVYTRAHQLSKDDPIPLEKSAEVLEMMGRLREAAQQYVNVAEVYLNQHDLDKAVGNWKQATRLSPGFIGVHAKLAQAYERMGDKKRAIYEYLVLGFNFQRAGETEKGMRAVQRALKLDRKHPHALNMLRALETGGQVAPPTPEDEPAGSKDSVANFDPFGDFDDRQAIGAAHPLGPIGEAMDTALGILASYVVESGNLDAAGSSALLAMELQRQGQNADAIDAYQKAENGLRHPALQLNLGGLLVLADQAQDAIVHLGEAVMLPELNAGAFHGLGLAYYQQGKQKQASRYLIQSLQAVDTALAMDMDEIQDLSDVYGQLLATLDGRTDESLGAINKRFTNLLKGKDWKQRIAETRRQLQEAMRVGGEQGVVDILVTTHSDKLTQSVSLIDRYLRQGMLTLAIEEAHYAVEYAPNYLPVHVRMAEIMMREGRVRQAINKYNIVARTYMVRGENDRAASILGEVLEMAPLDIEIHTSLIELLEAEERWDEALEQYIDLADTYHQLGDFDMSRNTYNLAERIASRVNASPDKVVRIKHRVADIDQMRLDIRKAQRTYEEIIQLDPEDERARRMLIDLNFRQGNQVDAIKRLDQLLGLFAKKKQVNRIMQLLEELVAMYPNDTGLRSRLAAIYRQLNRKKDAVIQLDALGELQLEAGMHEEAATTIRQIIALEPDGLDDYKRLLAQLGG
ncbi:MAG: tetratricopeptide repeat protein [Anaerolineae bacterium]|nr:tetratricopeptide repeat protein [Anaerolineae bacterium]